MGVQGTAVSNLFGSVTSYLMYADVRDSGMTSSQARAVAGECKWNGDTSNTLTLRRSAINITGAMSVPRPYLVIELWGRESGSTADSCLGFSRVWLAKGFPGHGEGIWVLLRQGSPVEGQLYVELTWKLPATPQWEVEVAKGTTGYF